MGKWSYNPTYRSPITPFITIVGVHLVGHLASGEKFGSCEFCLLHRRAVALSSSVYGSHGRSPDRYSRGVFSGSFRSLKVPWKHIVYHIFRQLWLVLGEKLLKDFFQYINCVHKYIVGMPPCYLGSRVACHNLSFNFF